MPFQHCPANATHFFIQRQVSAILIAARAIAEPRGRPNILFSGVQIIMAANQLFRLSAMSRYRWNENKPLYISGPRKRLLPLQNRCLLVRLSSSTMRHRGGQASNHRPVCKTQLRPIAPLQHCPSSLDPCILSPSVKGCAFYRACFVFGRRINDCSFHH
jgi:hypothetical protein